jgi:diguanylate cyclase (GGDEF)-like protein
LSTQEQTQDTDTQLEALLRPEEQKSERYANYARLMFTFLYFTVLLAIHKELPAQSVQAVIIAACINLLYGIVIFFILRRSNPPAWIKYPSIAIDILLLSVVIYAFSTFRSFKTEAFLLYYLWIGLSTLRFSPLLTLASGLLSIFAYGLITWLAIINETIVLGTITEHYVSDKVSSINTALKLLFLAVFVALAVYIAKVFRLIASRAISRKILQDHTIQLNQALDKLRTTQKELAEKNRELATLSEIDSLTQLYNRRKIDQIMGQAVRQASSSSPLTLILLDIDHFKTYNDRFGHQAGDNVIRQVAHILLHSARANDYIGRWDGEAFLIVCQETNGEQALIFAERLRRTIAEDTTGRHNGVSCSFGISCFRQGDQEASLLKRADNALYRAKAEGRNRVIMLDCDRTDSLTQTVHSVA